MGTHLLKSIFLISLVCLTRIVTYAHDFEVDGIYYNITDPANKEVAVTYKGTSRYSYDNEYSGKVVIPVIVTNGGTKYSVTSIGESAFHWCDGLTSVTIPNSVTSIGNSTFWGCSSLTSVTIPNSVTSIGDYAFYECSSLTSVTIPNSVTRIGDYAFYECSSLTSVTIPNSVTSIGESAFEDCSSLTSVTIPNSVTSIENSTFRGCSGLTSVTIPNSVTSIENSTFRGCSGLTSVTIPNSVTSIGVCVLSDCSALTSIVVETGNTKYDSRENCNAIIESDTNELIVGCKNTIILNSVTSIGNSAFEDCSGLTSVTIPNSVTSIGNSAFEDCSSLTSVIIGNSVTSIGNYAFYDCSGLKTIYNLSNLKFTIGSTDYGYIARYAKIIYEIPNISFEGDYIFGKPKNINTLLHYIGNDTDLTLPDNYRGENYVIGESVFKDNTTLSSVTIPNSVTSIGEDAFRGCSGLTSVTIPNSVTSIGNSAFRGCSGLTSVTIPNSVTSIGNSTFWGCSGLTSVTIPNSVTRIGDYAFYECSSLTSVTIPNSVTRIGDYAFRGCSGLTSVTIPNSVTRIGDYAFYECSGLTSVTIPNSVTRIGDYAFYECSSLTSVTIPNSVTSIGYSAFLSCSGLTGIVVETGNTKYDSRENCNAIIDSDTNELIVGCKNTIIPNSVTSIGIYAFYDCSGLTSVTIPNSVTSIGYAAFYDCSGLTSIVVETGNTKYDSRENCNAIIDSDTNELIVGCKNTIIPNSVTSIGEYAFRSCSGLTSIMIPNSVTSIGEYAFENCSGLKTIYNLSNLKFTIGSTDYGYIARYAEIIYEIPNGSLEGDYIFGKPENINTLLYYIGNDTDLTLPDNYRGENYVIGESVFKDNTTLSSVTIPNSVSSIGNYAFYNCSGLTSITIPNSVTSIGEYAFCNCNSLKTIYNFSNLEFTKGSTNYGYIAFYAEDIYNAPNGSVEGDYIFGKPNSINTLLYYIGNDTDLTLPDNYRGVNYVIGERVFAENITLITVKIPNSVTSIGASAFRSCSGLTSIKIPNSVTSIGNNAFHDCYKVESLYISSAIETIGEYAFAGCTSIYEIQMASKKAITANENIFSTDTYNNAILYVPIGRTFAFEKTSPWKNFYIQEKDYAGIEDIIADDNSDEQIEYFNLNGVRVENPQNGIFIRRQGNKVGKVILK